MNALPLDPTLLTAMKFFVVLTCLFYWVQRLLRFLIRTQQPRYYRDAE